MTTTSAGQVFLDFGRINFIFVNSNAQKIYRTDACSQGPDVVRFLELDRLFIDRWLC
jgi:hypothetical protein